MYACMDVTLSCGHDNLKRVADKFMKCEGLIFSANITKPIGGFLKIFNIHITKTPEIEFKAIVYINFSLS